MSATLWSLYRLLSHEGKGLFIALADLQSRRENEGLQWSGRVGYMAVGHAVNRHYCRPATEDGTPLRRVIRGPFPFFRR